MKNLKVLALALMSATVVFISCEKNSSTQPISATTLTSDNSSSALSNFTFLAVTDTSKNTPPKMNITKVEVSALPAAITSYVSANYSGATFEQAGTLDSGNYVVRVLTSDSKHVCLVFDASGTFIEAKSPKAGKGTPVATADLPSSITSYIITNYAGATIKNAEKMSDGKYTVMITKADGTAAVLGFDAAGAFNAELTMKPKGGPQGGGPQGGGADSVAIASLPAAITTYVQANYSGGVILGARKTKEGGYGVLVKKSDSTLIGLGFTVDGTFVAILPPTPGK